jgi:hypothetical protein
MDHCIVNFWKGGFELKTRGLPSGDGLAAGVLGVGDGVTDDGLHEGLECSVGGVVSQRTAPGSSVEHAIAAVSRVGVKSGYLVSGLTA